MKDVSDRSQQALMLPGPTASGKTALVLALARELPIEIVSVDSALVFRDMDIGTAKPTLAEQAQCPHHLLNVVNPEEAYSAARFVNEAHTLVAEIRARGRLPVLVGGTMLYFKALREGLSDLPQADAALRASLEADAARLGWPALHARLATLDAEAAARLHATDAQRIQRALEVILLTGRPLAEAYAQRTQTAAPLPCAVIALQCSERAALHQRIAARFDAMLEAGLEPELRDLQARYALRPEMTAMRCVGYRQMWRYLAGEVDYATMREEGIAATRQLAKRQITWMRQFAETWPEWFALEALSDDLLPQVLQRLRQQGLLVS